MPFAVLLGQFVSLDALWASFAIGEYATAIIYIPLTVVIVNKMFAEKMKYVEDGFLTSPIVINSTIMGDEIPLPKEEKQKNFDSFSNAVKTIPIHIGRWKYFPILKNPTKTTLPIKIQAANRFCLI